ncbi:MAG: ATP phosphoribosyltransferase [Thaumarchaeota archaeon]|nr:ATP phosphoribosyltransferase [Candidatus Calditenuaceae archaeon]MDW8187165.1 ATP phosphoribosyltransferase [Nitrososphaerota archaeon]
MQTKRLRFAIPKGSLEQETLKLLQSAYYDVRGADRSYRPSISDEEIQLKILRPQEIPVYVQDGLHDIGITGSDWVLETGADVEVLQDLEYGRVRLVLAVPSWDDSRDLGDFLERRLRAGKSIRISTEYLKLTSNYIANNEFYRRQFGSSMPTIVTPWFRTGENERVGIYLSFGATEAKPPEEADAIVDNTETGRTLEQNNLRVLEQIMVSTATLITNRDAMRDPWKREKILDILTMFRGVIESRKRVHLFLNVREENLEELLRALPALKAPTVSRLSSSGWYAVNTVLERGDLFRLLPKIRRIAQGFVIHRPDSVLPDVSEVQRNNT